MTESDLKAEQKRINEMILRRYQDPECGFDCKAVEPVYDGIADEGAYLNSTLKVAWILKEPWDDIGTDHRPAGGGWSLVKNAFYKEDAWHNPVWQKIAYVMYGYRHDLSWQTMPWIRNKHEMINEIRSVAWINLSKMPGFKQSYAPFIAQQYKKVWRDIVLEQLRVFAPDVIVFGNTYDCMADDFKQAIPQKTNLDSKWIQGYLKNGAQSLIATLHPGRKGGDYVDTLITALRLSAAP